MSAPSTQRSPVGGGDDRLAEIARQSRGERRRGFPAGANGRGSRRNRRGGRAGARSSRRCRARRYGRAPCESLRARYLAPIAVTAPVRMSVMRASRRGSATRHAVARIEQQQRRQLRGQALLVVVDEVADDLHAGAADGRADGAAQHVEMAVRHAGLEMHARLDHRLAAALRRKRRLDRGEDLVVGQRKRLDVEAG